MNFTLNNRGKTLAGWPRITKRRELSFRRLESRSSRHWRRNLEEKKISQSLVWNKLSSILNKYWQFYKPQMLMHFIITFYILYNYNALINLKYVFISVWKDTSKKINRGEKVFRHYVKQIYFGFFLFFFLLNRNL